MSFGVAGIGVATGAAQFFTSRKDKKEAQKNKAAAQAELNKQKAAFNNLDTSNPFLGMENTMEDLTINQKEAELINQQGQQQRANIMDQMKGAAGGSGIAALAQQMAQSGQLAAQQSGASIGAQEAANQKMAAQEASNIQGKERQGEVMSREMEMNKVSTLLGMSQSELAGAREQEAAARAGQLDAFGNIAGSVLGALSDRRTKKNIELIGSSPSGLGIYTFEYKDKAFGEGKYQGTMSDEVPAEAVLKHESGYDMVDYSKIDVEFKNIN